MLGGFLGSGKTTIIIRMAEHYIGRGRKVAVLVNEIGEIGVDGSTIRSGGLETVELEQGCICCSLAGSLQSTMKEIEAQIDPDVLLIEPTGLALPGKVMELIRGTVEEDRENIIGIVDAQRFDTLIERKEDFLKAQLSRSDFFLINKVDAVDFERVFEVSSWLRALSPGTQVFMVSGKTGEGLEEAFSQCLFP